MEASERGETSAPVDLDETFLDADAGPGFRVSAVSELAAETERLRIEAGHTTEDLESLRSERERFVRERYGNAFVDSLSVPTGGG